jgi:hypothetical protein
MELYGRSSGPKNFSLIEKFDCTSHYIARYTHYSFLFSLPKVFFAVAPKQHEGQKKKVQLSKIGENTNCAFLNVNICLILHRELKSRS